MRPVEHISKKDLLTHLLALDIESRNRRFGFSIGDSGLEGYTSNIADTDIIIGIKESAVSDTIVAAVHLAIDNNNQAELGISTLQQYRRQGLAERLVRFSVDILRNRGIDHLYTVCSPTNDPLLKMFNKLNIATVAPSFDEREAKLSIPVAGLDSITNEMYNYRLVVIDNTLRPWAKLWTTMFKTIGNKND